MITLDKEQIKHLHRKLLNATGGLDGLRDEAMLDSALSAAFQTFDGVELYPSTAAKIARIDLLIQEGNDPVYDRQCCSNNFEAVFGDIIVNKVCVILQELSNKL